MFSRLILPLTYKCNLDCQYCYVDKKDNRKLSLTNGIRAIDFLIKSNKGQRGFIEIIFVGGEPLLEWDKLKRLVVHARRVSGRMNVPIGTIGFPTNGLLLNKDTLNFCRDEGVKIAVSADGFTNKRNTISGENSFAKLAGKIPLLLKYKYLVRMRLTVHPDCVSESADVFKYFLKKGFRRIDIQPVNGVKWSLEKRRVYLEKLEESFRAVRKVNRSGEKKIDMEHLQGYAEKNKMKMHCPKGAEELMVDVDGVIYPCEFFLSVSLGDRRKYSLGSVGKGIDYNAAEKLKKCRLCDPAGTIDIPELKEKCSVCHPSKACFKVCLGWDIAKRKFDPAIALSNWALSRSIEGVCLKFGDLL